MALKTHFPEAITILWHEESYNVFWVLSWWFPWWPWNTKATRAFAFPLCKSIHTVLLSFEDFSESNDFIDVQRLSIQIYYLLWLSDNHANHTLYTSKELSRRVWMKSQNECLLIGKRDTWYKSLHHFSEPT